MNRLDPAKSLVLVVDVQDKLALAMPEAAVRAVERAATILLEAADALGVPVIVTEQYPKGLGSTVGSIAERCAKHNVTVLSKVEFSAAEAPGFAAEIAKHRVQDIIVMGMETHVCVFQTARDLARRGLGVHVPIDGVASRKEDHRAAGLDLCRGAGAVLTTAETVAFDWLRVASGDAFKRVSRVVK